MYPSKDKIYSGIFIKEQIEAFALKYPVNYKICLIDGKKSNFNYLKSIFSINFLIRKEKFDLIHIHFGLSGMFMLFSFFLDTPVIVTLHGSDIQSYKGNRGLIQKISTVVVSRSDKAIILNDQMADILKKNRYKLIKIPCGINLSFFSKQRENLNNENFFIGFPSSRDREVKNYPLFFTIVEGLKARGHKISVIEFDNFNREEVAENLSKLDCLLMTSFSEGSPQIIKEALASNLPIISTNVGDVQLLLKDVENCFVVNSFEPQIFIEKVEFLIQLNPHDRKSNGKEKIKQLGLDQDTIITQLNDLYLRMINNKD